MVDQIRRYLRPGVIVGVNPERQTVRLKYIDRPIDQEFECTIPHPMAAPGWGLFAVPTVGTRVMVALRSHERPCIVAVVPLNRFSEGNLEVPADAQNICVDEPVYPRLKQGELAMQSISGSKMVMNNRGDVEFSINNCKIEYNNALDTSLESFVNRYSFTEGSKTITGVVRRDIRDRPKMVEQNFDKNTDLQIEFSWSDIGRNPLFEVQQQTLARGQQGTDKISVRNPALVEHRTMIYEVARSDAVTTFVDDASALGGVTTDEKDRPLFFNPNRRDLSRTDTMNLGQHLPNNLMESTAGTVVDYYGNILDINRNIIDFSNVKKFPEAGAPNRLETEYKLLKRSIKYHFEMNNRKAFPNEQPFTSLDSVPKGAGNEQDLATQTGYSHSRFSIDIDGEGLTKINIPASSNEGNIPVLSRYINNFDEATGERNSGSFRAQVDDTPSKIRRDVRHMGFGVGDAISIEPSEYLPPENLIEGGPAFSYRTAYHDIFATASAITEGTEIMESSINNTITDAESANAGGRSIHANLDGSIELNIGRDIIDGKSMMLDTAGGIISRIGADLGAHSLISQLDGNVKIQIGGEDAAPGQTAETDNEVEIWIKQGDKFHKIIIKKDLMKFESAGNLVLDAANNLVLKSQGLTLLGGSNVYFFGDNPDGEGNEITGHRLLTDTGLEVK